MILAFRTSDIEIPPEPIKTSELQSKFVLVESYIGTRNAKSPGRALKGLLKLISCVHSKVNNWSMTMIKWSMIKNF
jgi:hypothetical protein